MNMQLIEQYKSWLRALSGNVCITLFITVYVYLLSSYFCLYFEESIIVVTLFENVVTTGRGVLLFMLPDSAARGVNSCTELSVVDVDVEEILTLGMICGGIADIMTGRAWEADAESDSKDNVGYYIKIVEFLVYWCHRS